jgi:hypothetical protein
MAADTFIVMGWLMGKIDFETAEIMMVMRLEGWVLSEPMKLQ